MGYSVAVVKLQEQYEIVFMFISPSIKQYSREMKIYESLYVECCATMTGGQLYPTVPVLPPQQQVDAVLEASNELEVLSRGRV